MPRFSFDGSKPEKMTGRGWWNFTDEDRMFIGEIDTIIQINETGFEG